MTGPDHLAVITELGGSLKEYFPSEQIVLTQGVPAPLVLERPLALERPHFLDLEIRIGTSRHYLGVSDELLEGDAWNGKSWGSSLADYVARVITWPVV